MDIKKLLSDKKILIGIGAVVIVIIVVIIALSMGKGKKEEKKTDLLNDNLKQIGAKFYEDYYHAMLKDKKELANYVDTGMNATIKSIEVILPLDAETKKALNNKQCDLEESKIVFYPKAPYGVKDYSLKVELSCKK